MRLKEFRLRKGWTQDELARITGVSQSFISIVESGSRKKDYGVFKLKKLANALGVTVDDLLEGEEIH